ncbi:PBECR4 domain-containing protein [Oceanobacillus polygoni]|uniref:Phage-Barnase-EndoU-ColicinE5/D-RelE like nuclease 4 domain-containing protein n=1 Tax=Oceanobacillus polygoni TaxID=1235259 RepID=A0A9X1CK14_9BACI|nr:PBECR4 domain-containing protein [Oceanobacillus polygoni]MBP2080125.1 hypothetical protein [Oceanobacillus polygoni]
MAIKLTVEDLKTINKKPLESEISLQVISDFYRDCLMNRIFEFQIDYPNQPVVKLRFEEDNMCHLLGFQHIFEDEPNAKSFTGFSGYDYICTGVVTMDTLKQNHIKDKYKEHRERVLYFPFILQLLQHPTVILFSNEHLNTKISTEFILYDNRNNRYIHLGLDKHGGTDYYFPRTFFVRKKNDYIDAQTEIEIVAIKETSLNY